MPVDSSRFSELLLSLIPLDGSTVANKALREAAEAELSLNTGVLPEDQFWAVHGQLLDDGFVLKGRGKGGSVHLLEPSGNDSTLSKQ